MSRKALKAIGFILVLYVAAAAGWARAHGSSVTPEPSGFYVLDGFGGVHTGNDAPLVQAPYFGFDIARDIEVVSVIICTGNVGLSIEPRVGLWVLDGFGGVHASLHAPLVLMPTPYFGFDIARDLSIVGPPAQIDDPTCQG